MITRSFQWGGLFLGFLLATGTFLPLHGQQQSQPATDQESSSAKTPPSDADQSVSPPPGGPQDTTPKSPIPVPPQIEVRPAGSSSPLTTYSSFLRWGDLYVRSLEFFQTYDQINGVPGGGQGIFSQAGFAASVLRGDVIYDRQLKRSRLELEYSPRLTIVNGAVSKDFANQNVNVNFIDQISPRWTLGVGGSLIYYSVRHLYGDYFLDVNAITGSSIPSSFLDGSGSWLGTRGQVSLAYALSPRSTLSISPFFGYGHVSGTINGPLPYSIYQSGGEARWQMQFTPTRSIEVLYSPQAISLHGNTVMYQSGGFGYNQQFGPFTTISLFGGLLSEGFVAGRQWDFSGSAQLVRKVGDRSIISLGYFRGFPLFAELASQGVAQRAEAAYRLRLTPRWYWSVRGGYEDSLSSRVIAVSGKYVSTEVGYSLSKQWDSYFSYGHVIQSGNDPNLLVGTRNFYSGGIRWSARPIQ